MLQTEKTKDIVSHSKDQPLVKRSKGTSIKAKLVGLILFVTLTVLIFSGLIAVYSEYKSQKIELSNQLTSFSKLVGNRTAAALAFFDKSTAYESLSSLEAIPYIKLACLYDAQGNLFSLYKRITDYPCSNTADAHQAMLEKNDRMITARYDILDAAEVTGIIYLHSSYDPIHNRVIDHLLAVGINIVIGITLAMILASWLQKYISGPIERIHDSANEIIDKRDYSIRAPRTTEDEIGRMADSFNRMLDTIESQNRDLEEQIAKREDAEVALRDMNTELEDRIELRTIELARKNEELNEAMAVLEQAKDELVQSEKLASLGSIVAGVAHELNTPIGIGVTAASTLEQTTRAFMKKVAENKLTKKDLQEYTETNENGMSLIMTNLSRASELVKGFKQVAVDQTSEKRRTFYLDEVIDEIIITLQPQFKHTPHKVITDVPAEIELDSYPGPFGQVLTNLVLNSLTHGFDKKMKGLVNINVKRKGEGYVVVSIIDNGSGISKEHLKHVFDPFFTTKMGQGGSGLGMHISYTIITAVMGGKMTISSDPGIKTEVVMTLPLIAPDTQPQVI